MYKIGEYINLTKAQKTICSKEEQNGYKDQYFTKEEVRFQVLYIDEDRRKIVAVADKPTEQKLTLQGKEGYENGIEELDRLCKEISGYEEARSLTIEDIEKSKYWEEKDEKKTNMIFGEEEGYRYWLANQENGYFSNFKSFRMFLVSGGTVNAYYLYYSSNYSGSLSYAVRPVIEINYLQKYTREDTISRSKSFEQA